MGQHGKGWQHLTTKSLLPPLKTRQFSCSLCRFYMEDFHLKIHFSFFLSFENKTSKKVLDFCVMMVAFLWFQPHLFWVSIPTSHFQKWYIFTPGALARTAETCHINQQNGSFGLILDPRYSMFFHFHVKFQGCIFPGLHAFRSDKCSRYKTAENLGKLEKFLYPKNRGKCVCFPMESPPKRYGEILQILSLPPPPRKRLRHGTNGLAKQCHDEMPGPPVEDQKS